VQLAARTFPSHNNDVLFGVVYNTNTGARYANNYYGTSGGLPGSFSAFESFDLTGNPLIGGFGKYGWVMDRLSFIRYKQDCTCNDNRMLPKTYQNMVTSVA
jgi:hypothetical protein